MKRFILSPKFLKVFRKRVCPQQGAEFPPWENTDAQCHEEGLHSSTSSSAPSQAMVQLLPGALPGTVVRKREGEVLHCVHREHRKSSQLCLARSTGCWQDRWRPQGHQGLCFVPAWVKHIVIIVIIWRKFYVGEVKLKSKMSQSIDQTVTQWNMSWGIILLFLMVFAISGHCNSTVEKQWDLCMFLDLSTSQKS